MADDGGHEKSSALVPPRRRSQRRGEKKRDRDERDEADEQLKRSEDDEDDRPNGARNPSSPPTVVVLSRLESLPEDCRLTLSTFLTFNELHGGYGLVSRRCWDDVRTGRLNATNREWTVAIYRCTPLNNIMRRLSSPLFHRAFSSPARDSTLILRVLTRPAGTTFQKYSATAAWRVKNIDKQMMKNGRLLDVRTLKLTSKYYSQQQALASCLSRILPRLEEIDFSGMIEDSIHNFENSFVKAFASNCKKVTTLRFEGGSEGSMFKASGYGLERFAALTELYLSNMRFFPWNLDAELYSDDNTEKALLHLCPGKLVRVDVRGATWTYGSNAGDPEDGLESIDGPLPQEVLMKFVRRRPHLCWFRSDLTDVNIAILRRERPQVEFCS